MGRVSFFFTGASPMSGYTSQMKHYILLSVEVPPQTESAKYNKWRDLAQYLAQQLESLTKTTEGIARLGEGVWLLPRDQGMTFAAECMARARASSLKVEARFLSADD
jgi:hypothetical protein